MDIRTTLQQESSSYFYLANTKVRKVIGTFNFNFSFISKKCLQTNRHMKKKAIKYIYNKKGTKKRWKVSQK